MPLLRYRLLLRLLTQLCRRFFHADAILAPRRYYADVACIDMLLAVYAARHA